jgi:hypothetical protein
MNLNDQYKVAITSKHNLITLGEDLVAIMHIYIESVVVNAACVAALGNIGVAQRRIEAWICAISMEVLCSAHSRVGKSSPLRHLDQVVFRLLYTFL